MLAAQRADMLELIAELIQLPPVAPERTGPELRERHRLLRRLRTLFATHESVVQSSVWPLVRRHDPGAGPLVDEAIRVKSAVEEEFLRMDWVGDRDHSVNAHTDFIARHVADQLTAEEAVVYQLTLALDRATLDALGRRIRRALVLAPTRSHPDLPSQPRLGAVLAPLVGVIDRIRDLLSPPVQAT